MNMAKRRLAHRRPRASVADFEAAKREWDWRNPGADFEVRDQAMRAIAKRLGF